MATGFLIVKVYADTVAQPVSQARVTITKDNFSKIVYTNQSGHTEPIELSCPELSYSLSEQNNQKPYGEYTVEVAIPGLQEAKIQNIEIFANETSYQSFTLANATTEKEVENVTVIPEHTLYGDYPPKVEVEPFLVARPAVLLYPVVPEYIIVHDGLPTNTNAPNYQISFPDYIRNVASSEIYPTWPIETIKANVYAIISFTMNRIYTEWYPSRGYPFTITSTTNYDQKYVHNRTIFKTISDVVDQIFDTYIQWDDEPQPFFSQYSDGKTVIRQNWLSQWGSKDLGDRGYSALQILRHYYTNRVSLQKAPVIDGLPISYPGAPLSVGSCSEAVQKLQNELNMIRGTYSAIPRIAKADGNFGETTRQAVRKFQEIFNLQQDGVVGYATWYKVSAIYTAVSNLLHGVTR